MSKFTITAFDLLAFLQGQGITEAAITSTRDTEYVLPTERWVTDVFGPWFSAKLVAEGYTYRMNSRDCDKFSRKAAALAGDCNAVTEERAGNVIDELGQSMSPTYGLALGEIWAGTPLHARVVAVHRKDGALYLAVYEPQPTYGTGMLLTKIAMRQVEFTQKDIPTCTRFDI